LSPHPPEGPACGQPPHDGPEGAAALAGDAAPTAKADSCFSTDSLPHAGHAGVTPRRISTSNRFPQAAHWYSKSGMTPV